MLGMPKKDLEWHKKDIAAEMTELAEARGFIDRWSELSDVAYTYTRTKYSGHEVKRPIGLGWYYIGLIYMFPKYTLRWYFYYSVGKKFNKELRLTEVRNPQKVEKLKHIANKYNLDPKLFEIEVRKKMKYWVFLR